MNKNKYIIGLRSIEQLQANKEVNIRKFFIEYKTKNKRLIDIIKYANSLNIPIESANRARLNQICNDSSHQGVIAEISSIVADFLCSVSASVCVHPCTSRSKSL